MFEVGLCLAHVDVRVAVVGEHPEARGDAQVVWTTLVADLETPVSAFLKIAGGRPMSFLLESVEGGAVRAVLLQDEVTEEAEGRVVAGGVRGEVGDGDPLQAIEDALRGFPADEIVLSTHPPGRSNWLERGLVENARERFDCPIAHVVVDLEAASETG